MRYVLLLLLFFGFAPKVLAGDTLRSIPVKAHYLTTDESGNAYVVRNDNVLIRYNENGDSTGFYNSVLNGGIGSVDALNPLRVFVFYPDYSTIVWLDQTMNPQAEANLRQLNIPVGAIAAPSSDNYIWVYDSYSATLRKIDETGIIISNSNDLRQQLDFVPQGAQLMERGRKVFMVDTVQGVLVFDQFGTYLNTIPVKKIKSLQVMGEFLSYLGGNKIYLYGMKDFRKIRLREFAPEDRPLMFGRSKTRDCFLFPDRLIFFYEKDLVSGTEE